MKDEGNKPAQIQTKQYELHRICHLIIKIDDIAFRYSIAGLYNPNVI